MSKTKRTFGHLARWFLRSIQQRKKRSQYSEQGSLQTMWTAWNRRPDWFLINVFRLVFRAYFNTITHHPYTMFVQTSVSTYTQNTLQFAHSPHALTHEHISSLYTYMHKQTNTTTIITSYFFVLILSVITLYTIPKNECSLLHTVSVI